MDVTTLGALLHLPDLRDQLIEVEEALESTLQTENDSLSAHARRVVKGGGKRLRPVLTLAAAEIGPAPVRPDVVAGAVAMELVHVGTLVHDDIMDNASERRGVPTINAQEGVNHAILAGDYLLGLAGLEAARVSKEVATVLAEAVVALCDGQSRETVDQFNPNRTTESFYAAIRGKTSALISASCQIGALCSGATTEQVEAVARYGNEFGLAFQIIDDVLDIESTSEAMGKPVGNDLREGVYTLPVLFARDSDSSGHIRQKLGNPEMPVQDVRAVVDAVRRAGAVDHALAAARAHNELASEALSGLQPGEVVEGLRQLPHDYLRWAETQKMGRTSSP